MQRAFIVGSFRRATTPKSTQSISSRSHTSAIRTGACAPAHVHNAPRTWWRRRRGIKSLAMLRKRFGSFHLWLLLQDRLCSASSVLCARARMEVHSRARARDRWAAADTTSGSVQFMVFTVKCAHNFSGSNFSCCRCCRRRCSWFPVSVFALLALLLRRMPFYGNSLVRRAWLVSRTLSTNAKHPNGSNLSAAI